MKTNKQKRLSNVRSTDLVRRKPSSLPVVWAAVCDGEIRTGIVAERGVDVADNPSLKAAADRSLQILKQHLCLSSGTKQ